MLTLKPRMASVFKIMTKHQIIAGSILIAICFAAVVFAFTKVQSSWWIEDDPILYSFAASAESPLDFFTDRKILKNSGSGNEIFPVHFASFWVDSRIDFRSVQVCYVHNVLIFMATTITFFAVLLGFGVEGMLASMIVCTWMLLPATNVCQAWMSTRSYMYGLFFSFLSILISQRLVKFPHLPALGMNLALGAMVWMAMMSKEFFPITLLTFLVIYIFNGRSVSKWPTLAMLVGLGAAYACYRIWALGLDLHYSGIQYLNAQDALTYLFKSPYLLTGNWLGYVPLGYLVFAIYDSAKRRTDCWKMHLTSLAVLWTAYLTLFPIWRGIFIHINVQGPWQRSHFILNTVFITWIALTFQKARRTAWTLPCLVVFALASARGSHVAMKAWDKLRNANRIEGQFVLNHPKGILLDSAAAPWYIAGIRSLYSDQPTGRSIRVSDNASPLYREVVAKDIPVWKRDKFGKMVAGRLIEKTVSLNDGTRTTKAEFGKFQ